jgi:thymidylate kinase
MWQQITNPDILIYLHVSYPVTLERKHFSWNEKEYQEQIKRMEHAINHADITVDTDKLSPDEVLQEILEKLSELI